ncbi:Histidine-rich protein [Lasiodiplodia theobromae]|uniref:Histidine-rich protein n=1 Tax=Lasiodiplodia theobromae TaxID=45133 RepID=UPI0015C3A843|nr:Histidine-rich protein [Lasiodiplodia theobromae]KAF4543439.1 Histidine-rich protein [Lasiodiplodia theobromae]
MFSFFNFTKRNSSQKEAHAGPSSQIAQRHDSLVEQPASPRQSTKSPQSNIFSRATHRLRHARSFTPIQDALARLHKHSRSRTASAPPTLPTLFTPPNSSTASESGPVPDWMSDISLDSDDLRPKQRKSHWKTAAGYISRNGHWIGLTANKHHREVDSLQGVHESNMTRLEEEHDQEIAAMNRAFDEERRRTRAASQRKLIEQKHAVKQLREAAQEKDNAIASLEQDKQQLIEICHRMNQWLQQRDDTINELRARVFRAEQDANRFARDDMDCKMVEDRNARQARYIHELLDQKQPMEVELDMTKSENANLKARVKDLENRLASQQRFIQEAVAKSMNSQIEKVLKENKRIMDESEKHRREVVVLKKKLNSQAGTIKKFDDDNLDQFWQIAFKDEQLDTAHHKIRTLRPDASKAVALERELIAANARLSRHYTRDANLSADVRETMNGLYNQLVQARSDLQEAKSEITTLKQVAKEHKDCESKMHGMDQMYEFRENVICALQKHHNRAVQMYQELRVKAGLESQVPEPGAVGMDKIHLRAMFEMAAQRLGVELTDKDFKLCEQQDAEMLGEFTQKAWGHEMFNEDSRMLERPLTATERVFPVILENVVKAFYAIIDERPMPTGLHPLIKEEEKGKESAKQEAQAEAEGKPAPVRFAKTTSLLDEVRSEAREKASQKPVEEQEEQEGPVVIDLGDGVERKQF